MHTCTMCVCVCIKHKALNSHQKIKPRGGYCTYTKLYSCIGVRKKLKSRRVFGYRDYIKGMKKKTRAICVNLYCVKNKNDKSLYNNN